MAALEAKLAVLRKQEQEILASITSQESKIRAVHDELSGENSQLAQERREIEKQEKQLQKEVVSSSSCSVC